MKLIHIITQQYKSGIEKFASLYKVRGCFVLLFIFIPNALGIRYSPGSIERTFKAFPFSHLFFFLSMRLRQESDPLH